MPGTLASPFAPTSIWNTPKGAGAILVPANIGRPVNIAEEEDIIVHTPTEPLREFQGNAVGWDCPGGGNRCIETTPSGVSVPLSDTFLIPDECPQLPNSSSSIINADGVTATETQPFARCAVGSDPTYLTVAGIYQGIDVINGDGIEGSHGGSGMSALGGTIRIGEGITVGETIGHALKLILPGSALSPLGGPPGDQLMGFRWPAQFADTGFETLYTSSVVASRMGSLYVLPPTFNVAGLRTEPGRIIARTLLARGGYCVDISADASPVVGIAIERGPAGRYGDEFFTAWGIDFGGDVDSGNDFADDVADMVVALAVVDNNREDNIGGGGQTPGSIYTNDPGRSLTTNIYAGATLLQQLRTVEWTYGIAQVPTATITLNGIPPPAVQFNEPIRIEVGFNGTTVRVFTGRILHVEPNEITTRVECLGYSYWLDVPFQEVIMTFDDISAEDAITQLLDASSAPDYTVNVPAWQIGTVDLAPDSDNPADKKVTLEFQTYGEAITKIGEPDGSRWMELPTGSIIVQPLDPIPGVSSWRTYFTGKLSGLTESYPAGISSGRPQIRGISLEQQIREVKNRVVVSGVEITQVNPDGSIDPIPIEGAAQAPSPWVLFYDGAQAYNTLPIFHELIDEVPKAQQFAAREVLVRNRLNDKVTPVLDGDPEMTLARTVEIVDEDYARIRSNWFVEGYTSVIDVQGETFTTTPILVGGVGGGAVNVEPFALFSHVTEREVIGDSVKAIVTLDASGSFDFNGEIVAWVWSDNQTPQIASGSGKVFYALADPATLVAPWEVTLTVTDDQGLTDSITLTIEVEEGGDFVFVPAMIVANGDWFSFSPDGGITWNDQAVPGSDLAISCAAKPPDGATFGVGIWGTQDGAIYRTTDFAATAPTLVFGPVGSPFVHVWPDLNHAGSFIAITVDARFYVSYDDGLTWTLWDNLRVVYGLPNLFLNRCAAPAPDGYWVFGGDGAGNPFIGFDPARTHAWTGPVIGGELLADLQAFGVPGFEGVAFAQGTFVGNGATGRAITGLGFTPKIVVVKANTASTGEARIRTDDMSTSKPFFTTLFDGQSIASLDADGFTVSDLAPAVGRINASGVSYYWYAFGGDNVNVGTYVGDASSPRAISGIGFEPKMAWVKSPDELFWRTPEMPANTSMDLSGDAGATNEVRSLDADGFTVGSTLNGSGVTYYYIAFADDVNLHTGTYVGDGVDGRDLPASPMSFDPQFVQTKKNAAASAARWKVLALTGDASFGYANGASATNLIQSLTATPGQFDVGFNEDVNGALAGTYFFFAFGPRIATGGGDPFLYIADAANSVLSDLAILLNSQTFNGPHLYYTTNVHNDGSTWKRATEGVSFGTRRNGKWIVPNLGADGAGAFNFGHFDEAVWLADAVGDTLNISLPGAGLPGSGQANHGLAIGGFIGGIGGAHIVATNDQSGVTLHKTWDRFDTIEPLREATGFPPNPAGADAYMINITAAGLSVIAPRPLYVNGEDGELCAFNGVNAWSSILTLSPNPAENMERLCVLRSGTILMLKDRGTDGSVAADSGLYRVAPGETTATLVIATTEPVGGDRAFGVVDFDVAPDGVIWAAVGLNAVSLDDDTNDWGPLTIMRSPDEGETWETVYTDPGWSGGVVTNGATPVVGMAVDPSNALNIFTVSHISTTNAPRAVYSGDGGDSWSRRITGDDAPGLGAGQHELRYGLGGRKFYVEENASNDAGLYYFDDDGSVYLDPTMIGAVTTATLGSQVGWIRPEWGNKNMYVASDGDLQLWITRDGDTWEYLLSIASGPSELSIDYDAVNDIGYILKGNAASNLGAFRIVGMFDGAADVEDITFNLGDLFADGAGRRSIAIPR